jgi:hypothetical protein
VRIINQPDLIQLFQYSRSMVVAVMEDKKADWMREGERTLLVVV